MGGAIAVRGGRRRLQTSYTADGCPYAADGSRTTKTVAVGPGQSPYDDEGAAMSHAPPLHGPRPRE
ncbi:hypothetical protein TUSST3_00870 [Streptomyces sp. TUS-ST3]|nr:hypothetical protein TUSST3_00870 [Streptomyces sp. TUS-ST3]